MNRAAIQLQLESARKQVVVRFQVRLLGPTYERFSGLLGDLELHSPLSLLLHYHRSGCDTLAMGDVAKAETDKVAGSELAVDSRIEHSQVAGSRIQL